MNDAEALRQFIEEEISKKRALSIVSNTNNPKLLAATLWKFILLNEHPLSWRATWFLEHLAVENTDVVRPYLNRIVEAFPIFKFDGQKRSSMKILLMFSIENYDYAKMINYCFERLLSHDEATAVRMFSMRMLLEIIKKEPELKGELKQTVEFIIPHAQKGLLSACRKTLYQLERIK